MISWYQKLVIQKIGDWNSHDVSTSVCFFKKKTECPISFFEPQELPVSASMASIVPVVVLVRR